MSVFKCKMCGATLNIPKDTNVFKCEYCDTEQTVPVINSQEKEELYDRANYFFHNNEYDKASKIYEEISNLDPHDPESYFMLSLCKYGIEYVEDPKSKKRIPTLHRLHFEPISNDVNYKKAIKHADSTQKILYENQAKYIDEVRNKILEISKKEKPYDVFICYKETDEKGQRTEDSVLAMDIYNELTKEGLKVFFSRITLEGKLGVEYEPYIFAALNSAKVMVVVGTKPEYINSPWVRNEWTRFLDRVDSKQSNKKNAEKCYIVPAYKGMSPYALPNEFSSIQAQDMSKVGATQDLVHGIKKLLNKNTNEVNKVEINLNRNHKKMAIGIGIIALLLCIFFVVKLINGITSTVTIFGKKYNINEGYTNWTFRKIKEFKQEDIDSFNKYKTIKLLKFYDSELDDLEFLSKFKYVTEVEFYNTKVNDYSIQNKCDNIKKFKVPYYNSDQELWKSIEFMKNMPNLEEVNIPIQRDMSPLSDHNKLIKLQLYGEGDGYVSIEDFLWCKGLDNLKELKMNKYNCDLILVGNKPFDGIENLNSLEDLNMDYIKIGGMSHFGTTNISNLYELKNLKNLELRLIGSSSSKDDTSTIYFANFKKMTKLQNLNIYSQNKYDFSGMDSIKELKTIVISGQILDKDLQNFKNLDKLESIKFEFTNYSAYGQELTFSLKGVEYLKNLKELSINTGFSEIKVLDENLIENNKSLKYYKMGR